MTHEEDDRSLLVLLIVSLKDDPGVKEDETGTFRDRGRSGDEDGDVPEDGDA